MRPARAGLPSETGPAMKFFVDTADVAEIASWQQTGLLDGVTTNPSLVAKSGRNFLEVIKEICALVDGPVSAEVAATAYERMLAEGRRLADLAPNVCVKLPLTWDGLKACKTLTGDGIQVNVTLCFNAGAGAARRQGGRDLRLAVRRPARRHRPRRHGADRRHRRDLPQLRHLATEVLVASVRHPGHVIEAARLGADVATLPPKLLHQLASSIP